MYVHVVQLLLDVLNITANQTVVFQLDAERDWAPCPKTTKNYRGKAGTKKMTYSSVNIHECLELEEQNTNNFDIRYTFLLGRLVNQKQAH